jgi:hypothetical protein
VLRILDTIEAVSPKMLAMGCKGLCDAFVWEAPVTRESTEPLTACETRAKVSVALAREAERLAAALLRDDDDRRALDDHEKRIRFLAFAGLRLIEPSGRSIEQAELVGFDPLDALRAISVLGEFRARARSSHRGHWLTAAREAAVADGLRAFRVRASIADEATEGEDAGAREPRESVPILRVVAGPRASAPVLPSRRFLSRPLGPGAAQLLGDPPPGRSALDRARGAGR